MGDKAVRPDGPRLAAVTRATSKVLMTKIIALFVRPTLTVSSIAVPFLHLALRFRHTVLNLRKSANGVNYGWRDLPEATATWTDGFPKTLSREFCASVSTV